uniref:Pectinesterase n=1 Tax=Romanomermis culicivorax TaxID=13658 RepID=A0A915IBG6_ROMCU
FPILRASNAVRFIALIKEKLNHNTLTKDALGNINLFVHGSSITGAKMAGTEYHDISAGAPNKFTRMYITGNSRSVQSAASVFSVTRVVKFYKCESWRAPSHPN